MPATQMKPTRTIALHKTFEKSEDMKRGTTLFVSDGTATNKLTEKEISPYFDSLSPQTLRLTSVHACDPMLLNLGERGFKIHYTHWHNTGIAKNLPSDEIAAKFAQLPDSVFREFKPRLDIANLRMRVSQRLALLEYKKAVVLKIKGPARLAGQLNDDEYSADIIALLENADEFDVSIPVIENGKEKKLSIDTVIAHMAEKIRECVLFNEAAHITGSWNTAAAVVAFLGGIDRFPMVSSLWHYCGEHVRDGKAPKRAKGQPMDWNPKLRTVLWQMSDSLIKNRNNPWRDFYEKELAKELVVHAEKHPGCKTPQGHCGARARRKMRKEILKEFFVAATDSRDVFENHESHAI